jgi:serine/threonine protein phosphatase PrpC
MLQVPLQTSVMERARAPFCRVGIASLQGLRPSMEDAHISTLLPVLADDTDAADTDAAAAAATAHPLTGANVFVAGVIDGHGGGDLSRYIARALPAYLSRLSRADLLDDSKLQHAFLSLDAAILADPVLGGQGATACVALLWPLARRRLPSDAPADAAPAAWEWVTADHPYHERALQVMRARVGIEARRSAAPSIDSNADADAAGAAAPPQQHLFESAAAQLTTAAADTDDIEIELSVTILNAGDSRAMLVAQAPADPAAEAAAAEAHLTNALASGDADAIAAAIAAVSAATERPAPYSTLHAPLTVDHTPELPAEAERILAAGYRVVGGRLALPRNNSSLGPSRAFGDEVFKRAAGLPLSQQACTALPEVTRATLAAGATLLVACDGVFETFETPEAADALCGILEAHGAADPAAAAARLAAEAVVHSGDNVSVLVLGAYSGDNYLKPSSTTETPTETDSALARVSHLPTHEVRLGPFRYALADGVTLNAQFALPYCANLLSDTVGLSVTEAAAAMVAADPSAGAADQVEAIWRLYFEAQTTNLLLRQGAEFTVALEAVAALVDAGSNADVAASVAEPESAPAAARAAAALAAVMTPAQMQALALRFPVLLTAGAAGDSAASAEEEPKLDAAALLHFVSRRWFLPSTVRRTLEQRHPAALAPALADAPALAVRSALAAPRMQADGARLVAAYAALAGCEGSAALLGLPSPAAAAAAAATATATAAAADADIDTAPAATPAARLARTFAESTRRLYAAAVLERARHLAGSGAGAASLSQEIDLASHAALSTAGSLASRSDFARFLRVLSATEEFQPQSQSHAQAPAPAPAQKDAPVSAAAVSVRAAAASSSSSGLGGSPLASGSSGSSTASATATATVSAPVATFSMFTPAASPLLPAGLARAHAAVAAARSTPPQSPAAAAAAAAATARALGRGARLSAVTMGFRGLGLSLGAAAAVGAGSSAAVAASVRASVGVSLARAFSSSSSSSSSRASTRAEAAAAAAAKEARIEELLRRLAGVQPLDVSELETGAKARVNAEGYMLDTDEHPGARTGVNAPASTGSVAADAAEDFQLGKVQIDKDGNEFIDSAVADDDSEWEREAMAGMDAETREIWPEVMQRAEELRQRLEEHRGDPNYGIREEDFTFSDSELLAEKPVPEPSPETKYRDLTVGMMRVMGLDPRTGEPMQQQQQQQHAPSPPSSAGAMGGAYPALSAGGAAPSGSGRREYSTFAARSPATAAAAAAAQAQAQPQSTGGVVAEAAAAAAAVAAGSSLAVVQTALRCVKRII